MIKKYLLLLKFSNLLKPYKSKIIIYMLCRWMSLGVAMATPLLTKYLIDHVIKMKDWRLFTIILGAAIGLMFLGIIVSAVISYISTYMEERVGYDLQKKIQKKWEKISINYFKNFGVGEQIYRRTTDVNNIINGIINIFPTFIMNNIEFIVFFIIAAYLNLKLTLIYMISIPFLILIEIYHSKSIRPIQKNIQEISAEINDSISQYASGIAVIKIFRQEKCQSQKYIQKLGIKIRKVFHKWRRDLQYQSLGWLCSSGWNVIVIFYGWVMVMQNRLTLGSLMALSIYLTRLSRPIDSFNSLIQSLVLSSVSAERVLQILNAPEEKSGSPLIIDTKLSKKTFGQLIFQNIEFGYFDSLPVLKGVNCIFEPGKIIGIIGPNGVGKTTLINLIGRFYEPWKGKIFFNGIDIRALPVNQFRKYVSINPQDPFLFYGTIRENIICGNRKANEQEMLEATKLADAHNFIISLKDSYKTVIGKRFNLSKGQSQKIAIARSFMKECSILIFDEGLNSLDINSKRKILNSLRIITRNKGKITILIAHDVDTLMECDEIFVLMNGTICEKGSPDVLLSNEGFAKYLQLKSQFEEMRWAEEVESKIN
jgi:ABC-type multidrug transport system fused ATPase/permease subunit